MTDSSRTKSGLQWAVDLIAIGGLAGMLMLVYFYEARASRISREGFGGPMRTSDGIGVDTSKNDGRSLDGPSPSVAVQPAETVTATAEPSTDSRGALARTSSPSSPFSPVVKSQTRRKSHEVRNTLALAVSKPAYDDIGKVLANMGKGYRDYDQPDWSQLQDPEQLQAYDVLFLTCNEPKYLPDSAVATIREFVHAGNTLYVSDLWYDLVARAFPEAGGLTENIELGQAQEINAEVVDPSLRQTLGDRLKLRFDQKGWVPARFSGSLVTPLIRGHFEGTSGALRDEPLVVKMPAGLGTILFTSFHHSERVNESERKLLKSLLVIVATARVERELRETAIRGGLSPRQSHMLTASHGGEPVSQTYLNRRRGRLKFILGFEKLAGVDLKLTIKGPDGTVLDKNGKEGFEIEVPDAAPGDWTSTISIIEVPYDDFGYQLLIVE